MQSDRSDTPATAGKQATATMLATTRIPAATGTPAFSKGHQQEKPQAKGKTPATADLCGKTIKKWQDMRPEILL